jgi:hypothetical protein
MLMAQMLRRVLMLMHPSAGAFLVGDELSPLWHHHYNLQLFLFILIIYVIGRGNYSSSSSPVDCVVTRTKSSASCSQLALAFAKAIREQQDQASTVVRFLSAICCGARLAVLETATRRHNRRGTFHCRLPLSCALQGSVDGSLLLCQVSHAALPLCCKQVQLLLRSQHLMR